MREHINCDFQTLIASSARRLWSPLTFEDWFAAYLRFPESWIEINVMVNHPSLAAFSAVNVEYRSFA